MNEKVRLMIEPPQILLPEKTAKVNSLGNVETLGQRLQLRLEWAFARNYKLRLGELNGEGGKSSNRRSHAFFIDQSTSLEDPP